MATFYLVSQWLAQYGQFVAGMSYTMSIKLLSIYTVGSLLCVFITAPLIRNTVRPTTLLMLYTFISFIALFTVCLHPTFYVVIIFAFVIGFTSAGGVVQIGLTLMAERFPPTLKVKLQGIYYSAGSIATFTIPLITAHLSQRSIADIMWFDTAIAAIGFFTGAVYRLTQPQRNAASLAKGKCRSGWVMQYSFQVMQDLTDK